MSDPYSFGTSEEDIGPRTPLKDFRKLYYQELRQKPEVYRKLLALTDAEVGNQGPEAQQAFIETVMNRAASRRQSLDATMQRDYYPGLGNINKVSPKERENYTDLIDQVFTGSNIGNYATGNASGTVGFNKGPQVAAFGGERFGVEGPDVATLRGIAGGEIDPTAFTVPQTGQPTGRRQMAEPRGILDMLGGMGQQGQQGQQGGLLGMLGDPETMSYIAMMLKGANPDSQINPSAMLANAQKISMQRLLQQQRAQEQAADNARADRALGLRESEYGLARTERQERADAAFEERQQKRDLATKQKEIDDEVRRNLGGGSRAEGTATTVPEGTRSAEDQIAQLNQELAKNPSPHIAKSIERRIEQLQKQETDKAIPAELAGRLGMADVYLKKAPDIAKAIDAGNLTGVIDQPLARFGGALGGKSAEKYRDMQSGVDALTRMMTGAGMPASEAEAYANRYLPALTDDATTLRSKHDRLVEELQTIKKTVLKGRQSSGTSPGASPGGGGARPPLSSFSTGE